MRKLLSTALVLSLLACRSGAWAEEAEQLSESVNVKTELSPLLALLDAPKPVDCTLFFDEEPPVRYADREALLEEAPGETASDPCGVCADILFEECEAETILPILRDEACPILPAEAAAALSGTEAPDSRQTIQPEAAPQNPVLECFLSMNGTYETGAANEFMFSPCVYAPEGYVMLLVNRSPGEGMCWRFAGEDLVAMPDGSYRALVPEAFTEENLPVLGMLSAVSDTGKEPRLAGDINLYGIVNITDANIIYQLILEGASYYDGDQFSLYQRIIADLDGDLQYTLEDLNLIMNRINRIGA